MHVWTLLIPIVAAFGLAACAPQSSVSGKTLYRQNCVACHGPTGAGDGPLASDLPVAPANLRQISAQNQGVYPAERVMEIIHGYRGKDTQALMPEFGPVLQSEQVLWVDPDGNEIPTPSALVTLSQYLETLQDT
jgi:mono/diheme cytochrome c family protein